MKNWIIKKLGGFTSDEYQSESTKNRKRLFRKGDLVYINHKKFNPKKQYFLLESYNGENYWFVSEDPTDKNRRELDNGVSIDYITFDEIKTCPACHQSLNQ